MVGKNLFFSLWMVTRLIRHGSSKILGEKQGKLRLFYLPPYSPELNPDEYVWNDVKNNGVGRSMITNTKNLRSAVTRDCATCRKIPTMFALFSNPTPPTMLLIMYTYL